MQPVDEQPTQTDVLPALGPGEDDVDVARDRFASSISAGASSVAGSGEELETYDPTMTCLQPGWIASSSSAHTRAISSTSVLGILSVETKPG